MHKSAARIFIQKHVFCFSAFSPEGGFLLVRTQGCGTNRCRRRRCRGAPRVWSRALQLRCLRNALEAARDYPKNMHSLARKAGTLAGILDLSLETLGEVMGNSNAEQLHQFLHANSRATFRPHKIGDKRCRRLMHWKPRSRVARTARMARVARPSRTSSFTHVDPWTWARCTDLSGGGNCCKSGPLDPEQHCHATTQEERSRPKVVLKRQDQLGEARKRKHFDASEWKKKRSNCTKCGKPNKQLSR